MSRGGDETISTRERRALTWGKGPRSTFLAVLNARAGLRHEAHAVWCSLASGQARRMPALTPPTDNRPSQGSMKLLDNKALGTVADALRGALTPARAASLLTSQLSLFAWDADTEVDEPTSEPSALRCS